MKRIIVSIALVLSIFMSSVVSNAKVAENAYVSCEREEIKEDNSLMYLFSFYLETYDDYKYIVLRGIDVYNAEIPKLITQSLLVQESTEEDKDGNIIEIQGDNEKSELLVPIFKHRKQAERYSTYYTRKDKKKVYAKRPFKAYSIKYTIEDMEVSNITIKEKHFKKGDLVWVLG